MVCSLSLDTSSGCCLELDADDLYQFMVKGIGMPTGQAKGELILHTYVHTSYAIEI